MECILGIDTSNYTTSLAVVSAGTGRLLASARCMLPVTKGQRGLRQSDALFFHVRQLPDVMADLMCQLHEQQIHPDWVGVGASVRPRPQATSYMPVFHAGANYAVVFAQSLGIPVVRTSHQEGHIAAAEYFLRPNMGPFVAVHISGGTSDVMLARRTDFGYAIQLVGEGLDLHAGQFVDRVGVQLGLPFPAGPALEALASTAEGTALLLPSAVRGAQMSFSGPLSAAVRAIEAGENPADIARAVELCVAQNVSKAIEYAVRNASVPTRDVIVAGGVAANATIRQRVVERLKKRVRGVSVQFAPPLYARDNALGVAVIAERFLSR
ncbi:peptidase M22 [Alicyclobacillus fodiniaquatilis]|uniref:N(6)-L-threonylcarbamoyladenine synthase n=1 Tax=Alicyclobacillus fodiniaquatilis TaxID=1661150 RepID=A0ABW4JH79_9BACL